MELILKVGYAPITIVPLSGPDALEQGISGSYSPALQVIEICTTDIAARQASTLVHELIHACFDVYRLKTDKLTEEDVCEALDGPLTALFTDNPLLAGMLHQAVNHGKPILLESAK